MNNQVCTEGVFTCIKYKNEIVDYNLNEDDVAVRKPTLYVWVRDKHYVRQRLTVKGFKPYLYAQPYVKTDTHSILGLPEIEEVEEVKFPKGKALRIYCYTPTQVNTVKRLLQEKFVQAAVMEGDVNYELRYLIDKNIRGELSWFDRSNLVPVNHDMHIPLRKMYIDTELWCNGLVHKRMKSKEYIKCITVFDSYSRIYKTWYYNEYDLVVKGSSDWHITFCRTTKEMMKLCLDYIVECDPDVLTGYNVDFDLLLMRQEALRNKLSSEWNKLSALSDLGYIVGGEVTKRVRIRGKDWSRKGLVFDGREVIDLLDCVRMLSSSQFKKYTLDYVVKKFISEDAGKVTYNDEAIAPNLQKVWKASPETVLEYNMHDVKLCIQMDEKNDIIDFLDSLRRTVGVRLSDVFSNQRMIDTEALRRRDYPLPSKFTRVTKDNSSYEGAYVVDPVTGRHKWVVCLDWACYSEDTEVLTRTGWKLGVFLDGSEEVLTFNSDTGYLEYEVPKKRFLYNYNGKLIHVENSKFLDFLVTPNHRVLYKNNNLEDTWKVCEAKDLAVNVYIPVSAWFKGESTKFSIEEVELLGWIISNSYFDKDFRTITIYQTKLEYITIIKNLLISLQLKFQLNVDVTKESFNHEFVIDSENAEKYYSVLNSQHRLNETLLNLPLTHLEVLFNTIIKNNTSCKSNNSCIFQSEDLTLVNQMQELAIKIGWSGYIETGDVNKLYLTRNKQTVCLNAKFPRRVDVVKEVPYKGKVWCVSTKNKFIVVRRNGVHVICGNSLYPSVMRTFNIDTDSFVTDSKFLKTPNDAYKFTDVNDKKEWLFRKTPRALFPRMLDDFINKRKYYKKLMNDTNDVQLKSNYNKKQEIYKVLSNSVYGCHSNDTKVLTPYGQRLISECKVGDLLYTLNPETKQIEVHPITEMFCYDWNGNLVYLRNETVNFLVTPNHNLYVKFDGEQDYCLEMAKLCSEQSLRLYPNLFSLQDSTGTLHETLVTPKDFTSQHYEGKVYCFTVKNHIVCAGREGKFQWVGQSYGFRSRKHSLTIAEGITAFGQRMIHFASEIAKSLGYQVLYGDSVRKGTPTLIYRLNKMSVVPIEQVCKGDLVCTEEGWTLVKQTIVKTVDKEFFRVETSDGVVEVTEDHSLINNQLQEVKPTQVETGDLLGNTQYDFNSVNTSLEHNVNDLYNLGRVIGKYHYNFKTVPSFILNGSIDNGKVFLDGFISSIQEQHIQELSEFTSNSLLVYGLHVLCKKLHVYSEYSYVKNNIRKLCIYKDKPFTTVNSVVKQVTPLGKLRETVYDLETENHHFSSSGVLLHNTDSIFILSHKTNYGEAYNDGVQLQDAIVKAIPDYVKQFNVHEKTPFKIAFEKVYESYLLLAKKRYAGKRVIDGCKSKIEVKGMDSARSDTSNFSEVLQRTLLKNILNFKSETYIINSVVEKLNSLTTLPLTEIAVPSAISKDLEKGYVTNVIQKKAADNSNRYLDTKFAMGDKPLRILITPPSPSDLYKKSFTEDEYNSQVEELQTLTVIAFDENTKIPNWVKVDYPKVVKFTVKPKVVSLLQSIGISWKTIESKLNSDLLPVKQVKKKKVKKPSVTLDSFFSKGE